MKKLVIALSNRNGCSVEITKRISEELNCDKITLREKNIKNCIGCLSCHNQPKCILNDDMTSVYDKLLNNNILVFVAPNYFNGLSGYAKNFFDRLHPFYRFPMLQNKKVIFIFVGGEEADGTLEKMNTSVRGIIKYFKFDVVKNFALQALNVNDLSKTNKELDKIVQFIKEIE